MAAPIESPRIDIPVPLVTKLVQEQFPQWSHLPIRPVIPGGWDNRTFHLGEEFSIRLPSAERYANQVVKEHQWLPTLAVHLLFSVPTPLGLGKPSKDYPWNWSVYKWIDGKSADTLNANQHNLFAADIAYFLKELQSIDPTGGPAPGPFYRGASPFFYDNQTRASISELKELIDVKIATAVWEKAIESNWDQAPVWVHGDFSAGNILVKNGKLAAVIDFGSCCVGDPACDLVIAWTFLNDNARNTFKSALGLDPNTWARARGWALWKALITLVGLEDKQCSQATDQIRIIELILGEY